MSAASEDIAALEMKLREAEQRAKDAEEMMMQAAQYGKGLLDRNIELEAQSEAAQQENYGSNLKLQVCLCHAIVHIKKPIVCRQNLV
jgi:hypothetical protein